MKSGVSLSIDIKLKVKKIADKYYLLAKKNIMVTSGTRSSQSQAEAMYGKLAGGDKLTVYTNKVAAKEIRKAYEDGVAAKMTKPSIILKMKKTLDKQIAKGVYISKHLKKGAVDIRSKDMTATEKKHFQTAARGVAIKVILETTPPHFHLQF